MPEAHVQDVQALIDLHRALTSFERVARDTMAAVEREVKQTLEWVRERELHWRHQGDRRQAEVDEARADLRRCQQRNDRDRDCSEEERALGVARHRLRQAEEELANTRRWRARTEEAVREYELQGKRFREATTARLEEAKAFLGRRRVDLEVYTASPRASSPPSQAGPGQRRRWIPLGDAVDVARLERALSAAWTVSAGAFAADGIQEHGTSVRFGQPTEGSWAHFDPKKNEIVLHEALRDRSETVIAAYLTHEGTHVALNDPDPVNEDSYIDQERQCFVAQAEVSRALGGEVEDPELKSIVTMVTTLSEDDFKDKLRTLYREELLERYGTTGNRRSGQA
jgi:hypothetical protein